MIFESSAAPTEAIRIAFSCCITYTARTASLMFDSAEGAFDRVITKEN